MVNDFGRFSGMVMSCYDFLKQSTGLFERCDYDLLSYNRVTELKNVFLEAVLIVKIYIFYVIEKKYQKYARILT